MSEDQRMSLEEWRKITPKNPNGFLFKINCLKCNSEDCSVYFEGQAYGGGGGCETCGYGGEGGCRINAVIKCNSCGNAFECEKDD
jgi:transcription elongation factor Elf1